MIRVLIADDEALIRAGLRALLDMEPDITVVGEAADGREAVTRARATLPDVVLMDIQMPEVDGIEATRQIAADHRLADARVVIASSFPSSTTFSSRCAPAPAAIWSRIWRRTTL